MIGTRYGKLEVVELLEPDKWGSKRVRCKCDCGNITDVKLTNIRSGNTKGCGCGNYGPKPNCGLNTRLRPYEWLLRELIRSCKRRKHIQVDLSYEDFIAFTKIQKCTYCGNDVIWNTYSSHFRKEVSYNLDRVDNNKGYTRDNCVVCCPVCNFMKGSKSKEEFLNQVANIFHRQFKTSQISFSPPSS